MADLTMEQCLEHLIEEFGQRYPSRRDAGLAEMAEALVERFGLSRADADTLLAKMEESGEIRHHAQVQSAVPQDADRYRNPNQRPGTYLGNDLLGAAAFHEPIGVFVGDMGFWQIGEE